MKRITTWFMTTLSIVVLLFSYKTSTGPTSATAAVASTSQTTTSQSSSAGSGGTTATGPDSTGDASADTDTSGTGTSASGDSSSSSGSTSSSSAGSSSSSSSSNASGTYTGESVMTRWGAVQVQITVENGKITASEAIDYPTENHRDQEINSYAVPAYNEAAVNAQSAQFDVISGATVTWDGYTQSLQSAIDQAGL